jgi:predicted nucleotidyltransferase
MKSFSEFRESIIDIPRRTYAPGVFDDEDTNDPKIKDSVLRMISRQFQQFETEYPILKYSLIGSILTKRYRNDADLDINVLFDVPEDKREEERLRLSKKYLSAASPDSIQGKLIPGTRHPVNYYFITDEETYDDQNLKADAVFDIKGQRFIKRPEDFDFNPNLYMKDFQKQVDRIDILKGELKRDIIDYDELTELKPGEIKDLEKRTQNKLNEIEQDIEQLKNIGTDLDN